MKSKMHNQSFCEQAKQFQNKNKKGISIKYILFSLLLLAGFTSCESDFLDTTPKTSIPENEAYSTPGKLLAQVNNLYGQVQNSSFYGGRFIVFNEQRADEFGQTDGNAAAGSAVWNQNVASTNDFVNNVWSAGYTAINAANILISKLNGTTIVSDAVAKNYSAEAKFIRALSYFSLIQTYAKPYAMNKNEKKGLPLRLSPITASGSNNLARSTVAAIYTQIIKDLDEAENDLPESYPTPLLNVSRAKKSTAIALKTRVYLVQGDYGNVVLESKKMVSATAPYQYTAGSLTHKLESNFATIFGGSYTGAEAIFSIPFANSTTETPASQSALAFNYLGQPILFLTTAGIASNPALNSNSDARAGLIITKDKQKLLNKFSIKTAPFRDYVPVIRYAEVLLNYAEATANSNDLATATALLQAVRNRSNPSFVFPTSAIDTKDALLNTIMTERRIELLGEGFRLMDLQRKGQTLPAKIGSIGTAPLVNPTSSNYIWPIPSGEISVNKLMEPND
jgi:starch-binding outer membrane protein, SusD/RagB family